MNYNHADRKVGRKKDVRERKAQEKKELGGKGEYKRKWNEWNEMWNRRINKTESKIKKTKPHSTLNRKTY